ncbi:MAG: hypothetical protein R6W86_18400 [Marinobacter sp.]|uniref:hypothetical protein n=1 Tax=Marinobacter sp. TaxID=50741 RepID=UPI00396D2C83
MDPDRNSGDPHSCDHFFIIAACPIKFMAGFSSIITIGVILTIDLKGKIWR